MARLMFPAGALDRSLRFILLYAASSYGRVETRMLNACNVEASGKTQLGTSDMFSKVFCEMR